MDIHIAGCAGSGTSLANRLMACFEGVSLSRRRAPAFQQFCGQAPSTALKRIEFSQEAHADLHADSHLIYCVRHPYDVLTSTDEGTKGSRRFPVSPRQFADEYRAFRRLRAKRPQGRIFVLKYEDLIRNPDKVQEQIAAHFGLRPLRLFSKNPEGEKIRADSLEKWNEDPDLLLYFASFRWPIRRVIRSFAKDFGYKLPKLPPRNFLLKANFKALFSPQNPGVARRFKGNPIIRPSMLPGRDGENINGPSLIAAPEWLPGRLGRYYLYFADHGGTYIRLAYADQLAGPWSIHKPGTLKLSEAPMCHHHIASPDVHVDETSRQIRMYFHGPASPHPEQKSFVAVSQDGLGFTAFPEVLSGSYLRCIPWSGRWLGLDMAGYFYRSDDGLTAFEKRPESAFDFKRSITLRHVALRMVGQKLEIYYTRRGDIPERIWRCYVDVTDDWTDWKTRDAQLVLSPEKRWEGAYRVIRPSKAGRASRREHALRDPAIFVEGTSTYLLYSVAGESGIAIAALS
ncbi:sulfotransferase [Mesorhizobium marinum]|uniref:sulfotransferase n=1 Tax=Mesorhizobium marinum TaxID=3228790 RepID=UPI003467C700